MAYDKVIDSAQLDSDLTSVADAIRTKGGTSEELTFPGGFITAIEAIEGGGSGEAFYLIKNGVVADGYTLKTAGSGSVTPMDGYIRMSSPKSTQVVLLYIEPTVVSRFSIINFYIAVSGPASSATISVGIKGNTTANSVFASSVSVGSNNITNVYALDISSINSGYVAVYLAGGSVNAKDVDVYDIILL